MVGMKQSPLFRDDLLLAVPPQKASSALASPQAPKGRQSLVMSHDRHCFQRITKPRSAIAAHLIRAALDREHAAQLAMMATESKFQRVRDRLRDALPERNDFGRLHLSFASIRVHCLIGHVG